MTRVGCPPAKAWICGDTSLACHIPGLSASAGRKKYRFWFCYFYCPFLSGCAVWAPRRCLLRAPLAEGALSSARRLPSLSAPLRASSGCQAAGCALAAA